MALIRYDSWTQVPLDKWRWPDFSPQELACRGTGKLLLDEPSMDRLQFLRRRIGKPMIVTSAYRSPEHNAKVGGAKSSFHLRGMAFDVIMANHDPVEFERLARECGFRGFGYYPSSGFMHIDTGPARTWGTKFPPRDTRFSVEQRPVEKIATSSTMGGGAVAGTGGALVVANELQKAQDGFSAGNVIGIIVGLIVLAGVAITVYSRWSAAGKPSLRTVFGMDR